MFSSDLTEADLQQVNERSERFAAVVKGGGDPAWASFLAGLQGDLHLVVLRQLVAIDLDHRWAKGERPLLEEYAAKFPELGPPPRLPTALVAVEYRARARAGAAPHLGEYRRRFPARFAELERLLTQEPHQHTYVAPADTSSGTLVAPSPSNPSLALPPAADVASGYHLVSRLGKGQFGEVWKATAPGGVEVAVKVVTQPTDREEARRELQALELIKNLKHPCLVSTLASWVHGERLHIAMEIADGSLRDRLKQCKAAGQPGIPLVELLGYAVDAAEGLDFLHGKSVLHRDIKPDNVLLFQGHAKVADFGLARFHDRPADLATMSFAGTPVYMAPELWSGRGGPASDQYGLAVVYAELRQGRRPFDGHDIPTLLRQHADTPPRLDGLPPAEAAAVNRALAKDPAKRYGSCGAFVEALGAAAGVPVRARAAGTAATDSAEQPPTRRAPPEARPGRRRWLIGAGAGVLAAGGLAWGLWPKSGTTPDKADDRGRPWLPSERFAVPAGAKTAEVAGRTLADRLTFRVGSEEGTAVLLTPPGGKPFYLTEWKVWNALVAAFAKDRPAAGEDDYAAKPLKLPAVGLTAGRAAEFCRWLAGPAGALPSPDEWDYAAALDDRAGRDGPGVGGRPALGGLRPVDSPERERGPRGIDDLGGNGREWTRRLLRGGTLGDGPAADDELAILRGRMQTLARPLSYADLDSERIEPQTQYAGKSSRYTTFRVAIGVPE